MQSCKIKVRPQSCRSCPLWRPCNLQDMMGIDTIFRQNMKMAMKWKSSVYNLPYMMGIDGIFRQNMKMALKSTWLKIGIGPLELAVKKSRLAQPCSKGFSLYYSAFSCKTQIPILHNVSFDEFQFRFVVNTLNVCNFW